MNAANSAVLAQQVGVESGGGPRTDRALADYLSSVWLDTHTQNHHAMRLILDEAGET